MKFTIVGAGALGTIIGAHLARSGHGVTMVARGARANAIREHGLQVRGLRNLSIRCDVVEDTRDVDRTEVLMFAVKTHQMEAALAGLQHVKPTSVVSVANGVMKNEQLADAYGAERVLGSMADTSGELHSDGVVEFTRNVCLNLGVYQQPTEVRADEIAAAIDEAGVVTRAVDNIATVEWSKFAPWVAMFTLSLVARCPTGRYMANPDFARIAVLMIKEAGAVAAEAGIALNDDGPLPAASIIDEAVERAIERVIRIGQTFAKNAPTHRMSSLQDLDAGRQLEVDGTLGYLVDRARQNAIAVPTLDLAFALASGVNALQADD
jgi:2-dehydropantoate 2-reductase